jgi:hypothetical protein
MLTAEGPIPGPGLGRSNSRSSSTAPNLPPTSPHFQRPALSPVPSSSSDGSRPALLAQSLATSQDFVRQTSREVDVAKTSCTHQPNLRISVAHAEPPHTRRASCGELRVHGGFGGTPATGPLSCPQAPNGQGVGFCESANAVPMPSKEQQLSAISRLRQPLSVVVQKKSLIRYVHHTRECF